MRAKIIRALQMKTLWLVFLQSTATVNPITVSSTGTPTKNNCKNWFNVQDANATVILIAKKKTGKWDNQKLELNLNLIVITASLWLLILWLFQSRLFLDHLKSQNWDKNKQAKEMLMQRKQWESLSSKNPIFHKSIQEDREKAPSEFKWDQSDLMALVSNTASQSSVSCV